MATVIRELTYWEQHPICQASVDDEGPIRSSGLIPVCGERKGNRLDKNSVPVTFMNGSQVAVKLTYFHLKTAVAAACARVINVSVGFVTVRE